MLLTDGNFYGQSAQPIPVGCAAFAPIPDIEFGGGDPDSHDLTQYEFIDPALTAVTRELIGTLDASLSFDPVTGVLSYDGSAGNVTVSGLMLATTVEPSATPVTTMSLTSSTGGADLPWTVGHFFAEGDVPAGSVVQADVPQFQAVVRNRWPDGSVKFAVLSGRCSMTSNVARTVQLSRAPVNAAASAIALSSLVAANPDISVEVGSFGTVALSSVLNTPFRQNLAGPVASEWQYRLPVDSQLCVWLYVRLYVGGAIEYMVGVENGYFDFAGATNKVARVVVREGTTVRYDSTTELDIKSHTRIVCATGHSGKLWYGSGSSASPKHNAAYFQRTGAVPSFQADSISESTLNGLAQTYTPYTQHNLPGSALGGGGDSPSIGWLARWDACYVVSGDERAYRATLVNSFASAAYPYHYRHGSHNDVARYADAPTTRIAASANNAVPGGRGNFYSGQYGTDWDISHGWMPGYLAYLLTGDYWHLEELQFAVKWVHYTSVVSYRDNATGLMVRNLQSRGTAWANRNCAMAAAITPDSDSERAAYANAVGASMSWLQSYHTNTLGLVLEPDQAGWGDPGGQRTWMSDYVVGTVAWVLDQKILSGAQLADAEAFMQWMGAGLVQRMSAGNNANGWHWSFQAYSPRVTDATFPANQNQANFDANWGQAFARHFGRSNGVDLDNNVIRYSTASGDNNVANYPVAVAWGANYFEYAMCALAQCVNRNVAGAATAFARITSASNYATCRASLSNDPRFGIGPRT